MAYEYMRERKEEQMNFSKSNIPLMRLGDIRRTLKKKFGVIPGERITIKTRVYTDNGDWKTKKCTATVIRLYPYVVQLQLDNGIYTSPGYAKLWLMLHGAE